MAVHERLRTLDPGRATVFLIAVSAVFHLLVAGGLPLTADEAHYALFGLKLDWSYFDHPPLVGWMQALVLPWSSSEWALRLWPIALAVATAAALYRLTLKLFPNNHPWLGFFSVLLYLSGVLFQAMGLALLPETPLLLFALLTWLTLLAALDHGKGRDWLLFGLCLGLAGLSKYTAITLVLSVAVFLLVQKRLDVWRSPGLWLAVLVAAVVVAPVFYWNASHDWISFQYQLGHGFRPKPWDWTRVGLSQAGQLLAYGPGLYLGGLLALGAGLRRWHERGVQIIVLTAVPVLGLFAMASGREETLPHWTALAWLMLAPLGARLLLTNWSHLAVKSLAVLSAVYSVAVVALFYLLLLWPSLPWKTTQRALLEVAGAWPQVAEQAVRLRAELATTDATITLMVPNWSVASRLAWYARPEPVQVTDTRFDQFDLWFGTPAPGANGLLVVPAAMVKSKRRVLDHFDQCRELTPLSLPPGDKPLTTFYYYHCRGYRGPDDAPTP